MNTNLKINKKKHIKKTQPPPPPQKKKNNKEKNQIQQIKKTKNQNTKSHFVTSSLLEVDKRKITQKVKN